MPMLVQGEYRRTDDGATEINISSIRVHPINEAEKVLPALPLKVDDKIVMAASYRLLEALPDEE